MTHDEFIMKLKQKGRTVVPIDEYKGIKQKIRFKCLICGDITQPKTADRVLSKDHPHCNRCGAEKRKLARKIPLEDFIKRLADSNSVLEYKEGFENMTTKCTFTCVKCKSDKVCSPTQALSNTTGCDKCKVEHIGLLKRTNPKEFEDKVKAIHPEIKFLTKYTKNTDILEYICLYCGYKGSKVASEFLSKGGCKMCERRKKADKQRRTTSEMQELIDKLYNGSIIISGEYMGAFKPMDVQCTNCKAVFTVANAKRILNGKFKCGCINKWGEMNHHVLEYKLNNSINAGKIELLSTYNTVNDRMTVRCNICNEVYSVGVSSILESGSCGCVKCQSSIGASRVQTYLDNNNIKYIREYSFPDLKGIRNRLRFDFAVFYKERLHCLIEYDGEFHFKEILTKEIFQRQKRMDAKKNEYCKKKNIKLLRIPYWELENIEKILEEYLKQVNIEVI